MKRELKSYLAGWLALYLAAVCLPFLLAGCASDSAAPWPVDGETTSVTLRMSVASITPDGDGSRLTLRIQGESNDPLPAFTATVASGQITGTTHSYQEVNVQDQLISAPASTLAPSDVDIPLRLNVTPDKVGFIRVHDIQPAAAQ